MKKRKPHFWLLVASFLFFLSLFFADSESTLDINIHDTYYVIAHGHLYGMLAVVLFFLYTIYWSFDKGKIGLIQMLSKWHIYGTLLSLIGMFFPYHLIFPESGFPPFDNKQNINVCLTVCGLLFLFLQLLFIINIFVSIIKKLCKSATLQLKKNE